MTEPDPAEVTKILKRMAGGDRDAVEELMPVVYGELRSIAARYLSRERAGHTLQPTALVNEAYLKLIQQNRIEWQGRSHFFAISSQLMRRILVDHARSKLRVKRGDGARRVELNEDLMISPQNSADVLRLEDALVALEQLDPTQAKIVEMRFFGGLTVDEVATVLGVSKRKVEAEWTMIRAWLRRELSADSPT